jgi:hypothetical protein
MRRLVPLFAAVLALAIPAAAPAATVTVRPDPDSVNPATPGAPPDYDEVYFAAAPGETNHVTVAYAGDATSITVTDTAAPLSPTGTCTRVDIHTATCTTPGSPLQSARIELGDGDDTVVSTRPEPGPPIGGLRALGGPGDDTLTGSPIEDTLDGGSGTDTITGGDGNDTITDGDGRGTTNADKLDGGAGDYDTLSYASHKAPVTIDLDTFIAGSKHEKDAIEGFENATGGAGDDTIKGTADGANILKGGGGKDTITGRGGSTADIAFDELYGGPGRDTLIGGAGHEWFGGGPGHDRFNCAGGGDRVLEPTRDELLPRECEAVNYRYAEEDSFTAGTAPTTLTATTAAFEFTCPDLEDIAGDPASCSGTLDLATAGSRKLGSGTILRSDGEQRGLSVTVDLNGRFAQLARRPGGVVTVVTITPEDGQRAVAWRVRLKR